MTRKLTIRTKLVAVLAVPLSALAAFAALQVRSAYDRVDQVRRQANLATSATGPAGVVHALESERDYETLRAIGEEKLLHPGFKNSAQSTGTTDAALGTFRARLHEIGGDAAATYGPVLSEVSGRLEELRGKAEDLASRTSLANAKAVNQVFDGYTALVADVLDADQRSGASIGDAQLRTGAELLNALTRENDIETRLAVKSGIASIAHDAPTAVDAQRLVGEQTGRAADLRVRADGAFSTAVQGALTAPARAKAVAALRAGAADPSKAKLATLLADASASQNLIGVAQSNVSSMVNLRAHALTVDAQGRERDYLAVTIASLLLAIALLWLTNRWITRPLRSLADEAVDMAEERLPAAVRTILDTPVDTEVVAPDLDPIRLRAGGEVRDVEVALNRVQDSTVALAVQQASLRRTVAEAYVNLGRRNQALLSRQLEYITQLESDEADPDRLEHLFRLDHLATRMRRNAESLLVLAGHAPPRTWSVPVAVADVVRGALGEVEGYRRVRLCHLDDSHVDGAAAADVSHVVAELVENALTFSPPDVDVEVYGRRDDLSYVLTVVDSGIGMNADDLAGANALLASNDAFAVAPSRFLGHFVVAQLAHRHDMTVALTPSPSGGVTATVTLPGAMIGAVGVPDTAGPFEHGIASAPAHEGQVDDAPAAALPRRAAAPDPEPETLAPVADAAVDPPVQPVVQHEPALAAPPAEVHVEAPEPPAVADEPPAQPDEPVEAPRATEAPPSRARIGLGTFADLRATSPARPPTPAPAPAAEPVPARPAAFTPPAAPTERLDPAALAELAQVVEAATPVPVPAPASPPNPAISEDLLPNHLPRRGRRSNSLQAPWRRDRPTRVPDASPTTPAPSAVTPVPVGAPDGRVAPAPAPTGDPGAVRFGPTAHADAVARPDAAVAGTATVDGDERFAFFAAFRAAAERAREEAGIDNRRIGR